MTIATHPEPDRAIFLDGIRGWASLMVLLSHLAVFFLANSIPAFQGWIFGFATDGNLAVFIFFVVSGFALSIGYITTGKTSIITELAIRRYIRLAIPVFFSCFLAYLLSVLGLFHNIEAGKLSNNAWLTTFYTFPADLLSCIKFALYGVFTNYDAGVSYNPILWTMSIELWGSFVVFTICALFLHLNSRLTILAIILLYLFVANNIWYIPFVSGICIAIFHRHPNSWLAKLVSYASFIIIGMIVYYSSSTLRGGIFGMPAMPRTDVLNSLAASGLVLVASCNRPVRNFFQNSLSRYLGSISFPLYLTHFLVLCSFSSYLLIQLERSGIDHDTSNLINFVSSGFLCVLIAHFFRHIESLAINASRRFSDIAIKWDGNIRLIRLATPMGRGIAIWAVALPIGIAATYLALFSGTSRTGQSLGKQAYSFINAAFASGPAEAVFAPVRVGKQWGYIGRSGKYVIDPQFDRAGRFDKTTGLAPVRIGDKWGYIDRKGSHAIEPQFDVAWPFDDDSGLALVKIAGKMGYINPNGKYRINPRFDAIAPFDQITGLAAAQLAGKWGYIDRNGQYVINPQFESAGSFDQNSGLAAVMFAGKWGYIDIIGNYVINPQLETAGAFDSESGLAVVKSDGKWGYIDRSGKYVVDPRFDRAKPFDKVTGLAAALRGDKWGFIDRSGEYVIAPQFHIAEQFGRDIGLAAVKKDDKWGYIDRSGKYVIDPQFDRAGRFDTETGLAAALLGGKWGYIDRTGKYVIPPQFDEVN